MGSSSVVGGECSRWAPEEAVDEHGEGQRQQSLGDALGEAGKRLGEVVLHAHLALEGREHGLDHEADTSLGDLRGRPLAESVPVGHDELHAGQAEALLILTAAMAGVGEQDAAGLPAASS